MQRGMEGRRIAVFAREEGTKIREALERAGARAELLSDYSQRPAEDWHGGKYAGLVIGTCSDGGTVEPKVLQLLREFLVAGKPVAVFSSGTRALEQAGGSPEDAIVGTSGEDLAQFTAKAVAAMADRLEEDEVDEMSEQSFPASDPPSTTPASVGHARKGNGEAPRG